MGKGVRTLAGQCEVGLQGIPACSVELVPLREEIPGNEAGEVLDCTVGLRASRQYTGQCVDVKQSQCTLSRPSVVFPTFKL